MEEGSLYPALQRLLLQGSVKAEWKRTETNRRARFYALTTAGRKQLGVEVSEFRQMMEAIGRVLEDAKEAGLARWEAGPGKWRQDEDSSVSGHFANCRQEVARRNEIRGSWPDL